MGVSLSSTKPAKRQAILAAARTEFLTHGYHGGRVERIAARAGANKQLIFHYFGSKDGLFAAFVTHTFSTFQGRHQAAASPPEALRRLADDLTAWFAENTGAAATLSQCCCDHELPHAAAESASSWMVAVSAQLRSTLDDGQRKGYFRDDIDHDAVIELIVGYAIGKALSPTGRQVGQGATAPAASLLGRLISDYCAWR